MKRLKPAAIFSDNCVLQRNKPIKVFGTCDCEGGVSVNLIDSDGSVIAKTETESISGKWEAVLPPLEAKTDLSLLIESETEAVRFDNVAIGEVWLCGGQSNMEFELQNCASGKKHLENDKPNVRFYYTQKKVVTDADFFECEEKTRWSLFNVESAKCWSAVGYIFGEKLASALGITVGLIGCNWGGTSASVWMSNEDIAKDYDTASYLRDYEKGIEGKSRADQEKEYREYQTYADEWNRKYGELLASHPGIDWGEAEKIIGKNLWPGPINYLSPFRPSALYESMLMRVCPYTLRGFLFYQGESDDHKPNIYYKLFSAMISSWRRAWKDEAPFLFVQLPGHRYETDPDYKHWCLIREAQQRVNDTVKDAHMICAIDAGKKNDIHPKDKEPIGDRLYRAAMYYVYGMMEKEEAVNPKPTKISFNDGAAYVEFDNAGDGLKTDAGIGNHISGFELAGEDMVFGPAEGRLLPSHNTVCVKSDEVPSPKYVRYLWTNLPEKVNLYNSSGLPAAPFRTDSFDADNEKRNEIRQVMEL